MAGIDIVRTAGVVGGEPRLDGRRISVLQVVDLVLAAGHSVEYVADQLDVSLADVHAALAYDHENPEEMDAVRAHHEALEAAIREHAISPEP